mmetsp:Transcript_262/g.886  ORF Transcript_262/g.886 Transcript_262/m.886 type:complete len:144 (-) Transcript_262:5455-5886(-)
MVRIQTATMEQNTNTFVVWRDGAHSCGFCPETFLFFSKGLRNTGFESHSTDFNVVTCSRISRQWLHAFSQSTLLMSINCLLSLHNLQNQEKFGSVAFDNLCFVIVQLVGASTRDPTCPQHHYPDLKLFSCCSSAVSCLTTFFR